MKRRRSARTRGVCGWRDILNDIILDFSVIQGVQGLREGVVDSEGVGSCGVPVDGDDDDDT